MVRYLKYIVLVFGSLGLLIGGFFFSQNRHDIFMAWEFEDKMDLDYLKKKCPEFIVVPCIEKEFLEYAKKVSLTGMSMGMKLVFNTMEQVKAEAKSFPSQEIKDFYFSLSFLRINNIAMTHVYKNYHGFQVFYPGYIGSLPRFYDKATIFSQDIINGLAGPEGIEKLEPSRRKEYFEFEFSVVQKRFYHIKSQVKDFIELERSRLEKKQ